MSRSGVFYRSEIERYNKAGGIRLCGQILPGPSGFVRLHGRVFDKNPREISGIYRYLSAMTHPNILTLMDSLAVTADVEHQGPVIPLHINGEFALVVALNATGTFYDAWRAWIAWTNTGLDEVTDLFRAHKMAADFLDELRKLPNSQA